MQSSPQYVCHLHLLPYLMNELVIRLRFSHLAPESLEDDLCARVGSVCVPEPYLRPMGEYTAGYYSYHLISQDSISGTVMREYLSGVVKTVSSQSNMLR